MKVTLNQLIIYFPSFHFQPTNRSTSQTLTAPKSAPKHFLEHTKTSTTRKLRFPPGPAVFQTRQLALKTISHPILEQRNILLETNKRTRSGVATENACATTEEGLFSFSRPNFSAGQLAPGGAFGRVAIFQVLIFFFFFALSEGQVSRGLFPERMRGWSVLIAFQLGFVCGRLLLLSQLVKFFIVEADRSLFVYDG